MSLRIEQNWKWSNKTFPHTLCVFSTSDIDHETTHCGISLTSNKNLHWASRGWGGGSLGQKLHFWGTIFSLKIGVLLGKYFRKQSNSWKSVYVIAKYHPSSQMLSIFLWALPDGPVHCHLQGRGRGGGIRGHSIHFFTLRKHPFLLALGFAGRNVCD